MLLQLGLPGFSRSNWRSNIRKEVTIHPDYHDLNPWSGAETADIVYKDTDSFLTRLLVEKGYLPSASWQSTHPEYFMEVKSATGTCDTQFYMSKGQYRLVSPPQKYTKIFSPSKVRSLRRD
jgi:hypothetical protein